MCPSVFLSISEPRQFQTEPITRCVCQILSHAQISLDSSKCWRAPSESWICSSAARPCIDRVDLSSMLYASSGNKSDGEALSRESDRPGGAFITHRKILQK